jgi:HAD superfamily hydrolase (TIGR01509 family)
MDMDGTITRFNLDYMSARRRALEELERMNLRSPEMTNQLSLFLILKKLKENLEPDAFAKLRRTVYGFLEEMEVEAAQEVVLYPGAVETIRYLRSRGLRFGLVTNNGRAGTELTLKRYQLKSMFEAVVTRDDCEEMKPDPAPVRKVLAEMQVSTEESIFIGDGVMDILAAKAAGLPAVAVATGPFTSDRLIQAEPDYLLGSVNDLPFLLEKLNGSSDM